MTPQVAFLINQSLQSLSSGNPKTAELYLNQALKLEPKNTHVLRFSGVSAAQQKEWGKSLDYFSKAVKADPKNATAYSNMGNVFFELKEYSDAIQNYEKAISLDPKDAEVWSNKGNALAALKKYDEAISHYDKALTLNPQYAEAWSNKGNTLAALKNYDEAISHYDKALTLNPQYAEAWSNKGNALNELKRFKEALLAYQQSLTLDQTSAKTWSSLGSSLAELKDYERALSAYSNATTIDPRYLEAWSNKSILLSELDRIEEAIECCKYAIDIDQHYAPAWSNQATFFTAIQNYEDALISVEKALALDPDYAKAWLNKGSILNSLSRHSEAITCFDRAIALQPHYPDAWANKGVAHYDLLQLEDAIQCCNKAIELDPSHIDGHWTKGFSQLMLGDYDEGWINYEYRWHRKGADQHPHAQIPALGSLAGSKDKKILVWPEQGFGDILQFARYIPELINLGAQVTFEVQESLIPLFQNRYACKVVVKGSVIEGVDYQVPLGSLPLLFKSNLENIPVNVPYIGVSPEKIEEWKKKLPLSKEKLNIGIACSGNINFDLKHGNRRPIPLEYFSELAQQNNLFLIQKEIRDTDQETLKIHPFHPLGDLIGNFEDTAAIVENMDLIISIDTSLAHLAGALGKETMVLLSWSPDWRWLSTGSKNPWYPTATLFRQTTPGDWKGVMEKVSLAVSNFSHCYSNH